MNTNHFFLSTFESKVQNMNDQALLEEMSALFTQERKLGDAILLGLKEIKARRIDAALGYASLFDMLVRHFKLSESAAYQRLQALKLIEAVPEVQGDLFSGALTLSNAALVQGFIQRQEKETQTPMTESEKKEVVEAVREKSTNEAKAILIAKDPSAALPPNKEKPIAQNYTQLQITVDPETMKQLAEVKSLLSHSIPDGNLKEVFQYMLNLTVKTLSQRKGRKDVANPKAPSSVPTCDTDDGKTRVRSRYIPTRIKRKVFARAGGCCEYTSETGQRCESRHQLELDHVLPWSQGGTHDENALKILCRRHNQYRTKETHGFWYQKNKTASNVSHKNPT